jgi:hypothetical protein
MKAIANKVARVNSDAGDVRATLSGTLMMVWTQFKENFDLLLIQVDVGYNFFHWNWLGLLFDSLSSRKLLLSHHYHWLKFLLCQCYKNYWVMWLIDIVSLLGNTIFTARRFIRTINGELLFSVPSFIFKGKELREEEMQIYMQYSRILAAQRSITLTCWIYMKGFPLAKIQRLGVV